MQGQLICFFHSQTQCFCLLLCLSPHLHLADSVHEPSCHTGPGRGGVKTGARSRCATNFLLPLSMLSCCPATLKLRCTDCTQCISSMTCSPLQLICWVQHTGVQLQMLVWQVKVNGLKCCSLTILSQTCICAMQFQSFHKTPGR